ncbi:MAG TPA: flagellar protein FlgN [Opitutaceae bacterium]|nr:flagellar protein FlgN [Opitutaceae bacterium]
MNTPWQYIADALRDELQEYGALLGLYDQQQERIFQRDPDGVLIIAQTIESLATRLQQVRKRREDLVRTFAFEHGADPESTLRALLSHVASEARPLVEALVDEINHLIRRTRRRARQNRLLLARAIEVRQQTLQALKPETFSQTYSPAGKVQLGSPAFAGGYQAAG